MALRVSAFCRALSARFPGTSSPTCCLCFDPCHTCCACEPPAQLSYQVELVSCISEKDAWWTLGTALRRAFWATRHRELRKTVLCLYRIFLKAQRVLTSSVKHLPATFSRCPSLCSTLMSYFLSGVGFLILGAWFSCQDPPALRTCFPKLKDRICCKHAPCQRAASMRFEERLHDEDQAPRMIAGTTVRFSLLLCRCGRVCLRQPSTPS